MNGSRIVISLAFFALLGTTSFAGSISHEELQQFRLPHPPALASAAKVELGRMLFFDRRLSGDGTMNCATCHLPGEDGFADGREVSAAYPTNKHFRNTPTAVNAAMRKFLTWDGRATSTKEQALGPIGSPFEMNIVLDLLVEKLRSVPIYSEAFQKAYAGDVTADRIAEALAAFEGLLISGPAPFDRYLDGDEEALSQRAKKGMEIFWGKGRCVECHQGPQFGGNRFASLGMEPNPDLVKYPLMAVSLRYYAKTMGYPRALGEEDDLGRFFITGIEEDKGKFLVPTLRQLKRTFPYGHDGRFASLSAVVEFLNSGGGMALHRSDKIKPLNLAEEEIKALVEFLKALTGPDPSVKPPSSLY
jgi:cytochrome c peroxidase